ncbi:ComEC/Rec2 family competence protein [Mangrovicella endophytica]|uniref:ComEC/Rec2 family competence protein n=1 Tax=Mangrovicella endophytica TaxID=2066697 RepID=UPI000C9E4678|nr:hypothetical protein [Mangrovicella endophytica]
MSIEIKIHDVGHGACAVITCDDGYRIMIDCGRDDRWSPSSHYPFGSIHALLISNLDEDHLADFDAVSSHVQPGMIVANPTITFDALTRLKSASGGMGSGVSAFAEMLRWRLPGIWRHNTRFVGEPSRVQITYGWNYEAAFPNNTNNLSLLTVVQHGTFKIVFAGDLETAGWRNLLVNATIKEALAGTNVLIASHHGRENGQSDEAMTLMNPNVVIFSDSRMQHDSQETNEWYRSHVPGIREITTFGIEPKRRHVFTTRRDGTITIEADTTGVYDLFPGGENRVFRYRWDPGAFSNSWDYKQLMRMMAAKYSP